MCDADVRLVVIRTRPKVSKPSSVFLRLDNRPDA